MNTSSHGHELHDHTHEEHSHRHAGAEHEHDGHTHAHGVGEHLHDNHVDTTQVVLNIGGDMGALVLYTSAESDGVEIDITPKGKSADRSHNQVHPRHINGTVVYAAVYPELRDGEYDLWQDETTVRSTVRITGGQVTELDWR